MKYAYIRVSTKDQNLERQINKVKEYCPDLLDENIFCDKQSGKNFERDDYLRLKGLLKSGDEVYIPELDRFGRDKEEIKKELSWFKEHKVIARIINVPTTLIDFQGQDWIFDMINNILIEVMGAVAQEERKKILERQKEGIEAMPIIDGKRVSLKTGNAMGRPKSSVPNFEEYYAKSCNGEITVVECCTMLGISRTKWYRMCKEC